MWQYYIVVYMIWRCTFEDDMCGMTQVDVIDWIRHTFATPTVETGPTYAYEGSYYIYIEANNVIEKTAR